MSKPEERIISIKKCPNPRIECDSKTAYTSGRMAYCTKCFWHFKREDPKADKKREGQEKWKQKNMEQNLIKRVCKAIGLLPTCRENFQAPYYVEKEFCSPECKRAYYSHYGYNKPNRKHVRPEGSTSLDQFNSVESTGALHEAPSIIQLKEHIFLDNTTIEAYAQIMEGNNMAEGTNNVAEVYAEKLEHFEKKCRETMSLAPSWDTETLTHVIDVHRQMANYISETLRTLCLAHNKRKV